MPRKRPERELQQTRSIAEVSADTLALETLLRSLEKGDQLTYVEITQRCGVKMDAKGRARIHTAAKRAGRVYATVRDVGITMLSGANGGPIVKAGVIRLDNQAKRLEKTSAMVLDQVGDEMEHADRNEVILVAGLFARVRIMADQHKKEMKLRAARPRRVDARGLE